MEANGIAAATNGAENRSHFDAIVSAMDNPDETAVGAAVAAATGGAAAMSRTRGRDRRIVGVVAARPPVRVRFGVARVVWLPQLVRAGGRLTWTRFNRSRCHRLQRVAVSEVVSTLVAGPRAGAAEARHRRRQCSLGTG